MDRANPQTGRTQGADFDKAPWRKLPDTALEPVLHVPTMLTKREQRLYLWLTSEWATGCGDIVDLGCFVGGSTARLAQGLIPRGLGRRVHAFDRFTADPATKRNVLYKNGVARFRGNDILPLSRRLLKPWENLIELHPGEIEDAYWPDTPIELLVMDASKTASTMDAMSATFFPHLVPGHSLVVQQDLMHWSQPWIAAQMEMLAKFFTPVAFAAPSSVVYACMAAPDVAALDAVRAADLDDDTLIDWVRQAGRRLNRFGKERVFARMEDAIRANPRERIAWQFKKP